MAVPIFAPAFSCIHPLSNDFIITGDEYGMISIWDLNAQYLKKRTTTPSNRIAHFRAHRSVKLNHIIFPLFSLASLLNLQKNQLEFRVVSATNEDKTIKIWAITIHQPSFFSTMFSFPSRTSVSCKKVIKEVDEVFSLLALRDGRGIATGSNKCIHIWNCLTGKLEGSLYGHQSPVVTMIQLGNGNLASGSHDCTIRIWDIDKGECLRTLIHSLKIYLLLELYDGRMAATEGPFCDISIWNVETGLREKFLNSPDYGKYSSLHQLSNGQLVASRPNYILIWDIETGNARNVFCEDSRSQRQMARLPDDSLVSCSVPRGIALWSEE